MLAESMPTMLDHDDRYDIVETTEKIIRKRPGYVHKIVMRNIIRDGKLTRKIDLHTINSLEPNAVEKLMKGVEDAKRRINGDGLADE